MDADLLVHVLRPGGGVSVLAHALRMGRGVSEVPISGRRGLCAGGHLHLRSQSLSDEMPRRPKTKSSEKSTTKHTRLGCG